MISSFILIFLFITLIRCNDNDGICMKLATYSTADSFSSLAQLGDGKLVVSAVVENGYSISMSSPNSTLFWTQNRKFPYFDASVYRRSRKSTLLTLADNSKVGIFMHNIVSGTSVPPLLFSSSVDLTKNRWTQPVAVEHSNLHSPGFFHSASLVNGHPALAWADNYGERSVKFKRAIDPLGASWPTEPTILDKESPDNAQSIMSGYFTSLLVPPALGKPCVIHQALRNTIRLICGSDIDGASFLAPRVIVAENIDSWYRVESGHMAATINGNGRIVVAYSSVEAVGPVVEKSLRVVVAGNDEHTVWNSVLIGKSPNYALSLAMISGAPAVAYTGYTRNPEYIRALDAEGKSWPPLRLPSRNPDDLIIDTYMHFFSLNEINLGSGGGLRPSLLGFAWTYSSGDSGLNLLVANDSLGNSWPTSQCRSTPADCQGQLGGLNDACVRDDVALPFEELQNVPPPTPRPSLPYTPSPTQPPPFTPVPTAWLPPLAPRCVAIDLLQTTMSRLPCSFSGMIGDTFAAFNWTGTVLDNIAVSSYVYRLNLCATRGLESLCRRRDHGCPQNSADVDVPAAVCQTSVRDTTSTCEEWALGTRLEEFCLLGSDGCDGIRLGYTDGTRCGSRPRRLEVNFRCGPNKEPRLLRMSEPQQCNYLAELVGSGGCPIDNALCPRLPPVPVPSNPPTPRVTDPQSFPPSPSQPPTQPPTRPDTSGTICHSLGTNNCAVTSLNWSLNWTVANVMELPPGMGSSFNYQLSLCSSAHLPCRTSANGCSSYLDDDQLVTACQRHTTDDSINVCKEYTLGARVEEICSFSSDIRFCNGFRLKFVDGTYCAVARRLRTLDLVMRCDVNAAENRLVSVIEPTVCHYEAVVVGPAGCRVDEGAVDQCPNLRTAPPTNQPTPFTRPPHTTAQPTMSSSESPTAPAPSPPDHAGQSPSPQPPSQQSSHQPPSQPSSQPSSHQPSPSSVPTMSLDSSVRSVINRWVELITEIMRDAEANQGDHSVIGGLVSRLRDLETEGRRHCHHLFAKTSPIDDHQCQDAIKHEFSFARDQVKLFKKEKIELF